MKAILYKKFGAPEVLEWAENWPEPELRDNEVLVKMQAGSINPKDALLRKGKFSRTLARTPLPKGTGMDGAGEVAALGKNVSKFQIKDKVYGMTNRFEGGVHAEFWAFHQNEICHMPSSLTFEQAACVPLAAQTALQALDDLGTVKPGNNVLINGASGGVGHFAVQIARILGAQVHAVCGPDNAAFVQSLGADFIYNYKKRPPFQIEDSFDCIFDIFGKYSRSTFSKQLKKSGIYVSTVPKPVTIWAEALARIGLSRKSRLVNVASRAADLTRLKKWIEDRKLFVHVDTIYPARQIQDAHRHIESRHTTGKICITLK